MVNARLRADFEPLDIDVERVQLKPDGTRQVTVQRAAIGVDKVTLSTDKDGQQAKSESPRPESPFIYGIETLVQRDRSRGRTYMLKGSAAVLADRLETTTANLRRIRMNGIKKINAHIEKNNKPEKENE